MGRLAFLDRPKKSGGRKRYLLLLGFLQWALSLYCYSTPQKTYQSIFNLQPIKNTPSFFYLRPLDILMTQPTSSPLTKNFYFSFTVHGFFYGLWIFLRSMDLSMFFSGLWILHGLWIFLRSMVFFTVYGFFYGRCSLFFPPTLAYFFTLVFNSRKPTEKTVAL